MQNMMLVSSVIAAALSAGCAKDKAPEANPTPSTNGSTGLDVSVTPSGKADVYVTDDKGNRVSGNGATGRVELSDGTSVPLALSDGGAHMTAPVGDHASHEKSGCNATVHVTPRNGPERVARLDMCRGMDGRRMGPGMEHGGEMGMGHGGTPGPTMGAKSGH